MPSLSIRNPTGKTVLGPLQEAMFQHWNDYYSGMSGRQGIDPNPDNPAHLYDYRGQFKAEVPFLPDPTDNNFLHGDSRFKMPGHSRGVIEQGDGYLNTQTGQTGDFTAVTSPLKKVMRPR